MDYSMLANSKRSVLVIIEVVKQLVIGYSLFGYEKKIKTF